MNHPPSVTMPPALGTYARPTLPRPAGPLVLDVIKRQSVPAHSHTSADQPTVLHPANITSRPRAVSKVMFVSARIRGVVAGDNWVHVVPSHAHVSRGELGLEGSVNPP